MSKKTKRLLCLFSLLGTTAAAVAFSACQPTDGPRFLKGIDKEIELGDGMYVGDYIDYVTDSDYKITVSMGDFSQDITNKRYWQPEEPGVYTVTYQVFKGENKGTNSFELTVAVPKLVWKYTLVNTIYDTGEEMYFEDYFSDMNISAFSYYDWKMVMDSVTVGSETIDLHEQESWTFEQAIPHVFKFHIETEDKQSYALSQAINVRYVDQDMLEWMDEQNITVDRALRLESGQKVVLDGGTHDANNTSNPDNAKKRSLPHLVFNGEYGVNDFVMLDFTGNNMPAMLFFGDEITDSPWADPNGTDEQNKGFVVANGWTTKTGIPVAAWHTETHMNGRFGVYGPNKAYKMSDDSTGFLRQIFPERPNPVSMYTLMQEENVNTRFRIFFGFTAASQTQFTVSVILVNLDKGEIAYETSLTLKNTQIKNNSSGEIKFTEEDFKGKIALYGMFGRSITLDKVHEIQEDTSLAELKEMYCKESTFNNNAATAVRVGQVLNVVDYVAPKAGANYSFGYYDASGAYTAITSNTFAFATAGTYTLAYCDGEHLSAKLSVSVVDIDDAMSAWTQENNVSFYNVLSARSGKVVLRASTHNGSNTQGPDNVSVRDMSYLAFNGNYGVNDFLVFDFTGVNMPILSFFNDEVTNTVFNTDSATAAQNKGIVVMNGNTTKTGDPNLGSYHRENYINDRLTLYGHNKTYKTGSDATGFFRTAVTSGGSPVGLWQLTKAENANRRYRVIVGFTEGSATSCTFAICVLDLNTGEVLCDVQKKVNHAFGENYFNGSIALYSHFGLELTLDQVYAIEQDTTMSALKTKYAVNA